MLVGEAFVLELAMGAKCPNCGNRMWQVLTDGPSVPRNQCPRCGEGMGDKLEDSRVKPLPKSTAQFNSMSPSLTKTDVDSQHNDSSNYFADSRETLSEEEVPTWLANLEIGSITEATHESAPENEDRFTEREREEAHKRMIQSHGLGMGVDAQGLRLTSPSTKKHKTASGLSPYDIVRLASELEGGVVPVDERIQCPACEAVVLPKDKICQWCSAPLA